jgi:hypothetical protein
MYYWQSQTAIHVVEKSPSIQIQNSNLSCETVVKLLGIDIDYQLNFDLHISNLCRKASQQLNILKHLGSLDQS